MNPISPPLSLIYQKNEHVVRSLLRNAPGFVYQRRPAPLSGEVPVFTFHSVEPERFERQCRFLAENGYRTLSGEEFRNVLRAGRAPDASVYLTFDDGLREQWTVAHPILRKYGLVATCFLIPGIVPEASGDPRPTLEDVWAGRATLDAVVDGAPGESALLGWSEIEAMRSSGVFEFHSHTLLHALVPTGPELFGFVDPGFDTDRYGNVRVPLYRRDGRDVVGREPLLGMPIYASRPRMSATRRFFDDEDVRRRCVEHVAENGGEAFFADPSWRHSLREVFRAARAAATEERYESVEERDRVVLDDLETSRRIIEERLPGSRVDQLCYPWYEADDFAVALSRRAGFAVNLFGYRWGRATNRPGDDPFHVVRVEEMYLERLPGVGRIRLADVVWDELGSGLRYRLGRAVGRAA